MKFFPPPPRVPLFLRGALASVLFTFLAVSVNENAAAQTLQMCADPTGAVSGQIDPHTVTCPARIPGSGFILTDPEAEVDDASGEGVCATCYPDPARGQTSRPCSELYNEHRNQAATSWIIYTFNEQRFCGPRSQCSAVSGRATDGTVCRTVRTGALGPEECTNSQAQGGFNSRPYDPHTQQFVGANNEAVFTGQDNISCGDRSFSSAACGEATHPNTILYEAFGNRFCGPVDQCERVNGVLFEVQKNPNSGIYQRSRNVQCDGTTCIDGHHKLSSSATRCEPGPCPEGATRASDGTCLCGTNQELNDAGDACVCAAEHTDADISSGGIDCQRNTEATICAAGQSRENEDPHVLAYTATCIEGESGAIITNPTDTDATCGGCLSGRFTNCSGSSIPYAYEGRNFCGPESQCIAVRGMRSSDNTLCCPAGESAFGGTACRAPNSSMECRQLNPQTPIRENNACRAAATDADCAGVFSPDLPIRDADGSCRLPGDNTECDRASSGAEPIFENNACRARNTDDCPGQILTAAGACEACPTGQRPDSAQTACECNPSTHIDVDDGAALDCRPICQDGQTRDETTMDCRPITAQDCLGQTPPQFLAQNGRCQSCRMPETPNDQGTACICPTSTHEEIGGACLELCDMTTEIRNADGECVPMVGLSSCDPNEHLVANACVECPVNQFRGTGQSCAPCLIENHTRPENAAMCSCPSSHFDNADAGTCDEIPECDQASETLDEAANECVPLSSCTPPRMIQETGVCAEDVRCEEPNQERDEATNRCVCESGHREQTDGSCEPICGLNQIQEGNACACAEGFMDSAPSPAVLNCILACDGTGERRISDTECGCISGYDRIGNECRVACGPNQRRNTENNLCACSPGYTNILGTPEELDCRLPCPTGQTHNLASGNCEAIQCPTGQDLVGNACVPGCRADQTRTDGACTCPSANPVEYRGACVQECSSGETRNASGACVSQEGSAPSPEGSSQGADSGGGDNKETVANILIGAPIAAVWGYLLFAPHFVNQEFDLTFHGENEDFHYQGNAEFNLKHGDLSSYARAIQSNGDAVAYQSGISYGKDLYSLNYVAYESKSIYDYDLSARLNYGSGPWSISPTADAEFNYSADSEDWTSTAGAGLTAAWISHKWNVRAHSAFAGDLNHGLDVEFRF